MFYFIKKKLANRTNDSRIKYLREQGAIIGEKTRLNCNVSSFGTEPYLIKVGSDCLFASDIHLITHDGGIKVLNTLGYFKERADSIAPITIGDNVYIGLGALVMPGVQIGNNCVIAANSVVTHDVPDNSVVAGVPARYIKSIDEYYQGIIDKHRFFPTATLSQKQKKQYFENII